jgi:uncharacterized protein YjeT (DUF2065 family)
LPALQKKTVAVLSSAGYLEYIVPAGGAVHGYSSGIQRTVKVYFMLGQILQAVALVLVIEGILPFLSPAFWRQGMQQVMGLSNRAIRLCGLSSMLLGVVLLYVINA